LADDKFEKGKIGFYIESAKLQIDELELNLLKHPEQESYPHDLPNY
jgi:hypothetical protein